MSEQWDGRPQNPERDGWHWLGPYLSPWWWKATPNAAWFATAWDQYLKPEKMVSEPSPFTYLGPCLTPAEVKARERAAELRGFEAAINEAMLSAHDEAMLRAELARRRAEASND